MRSKIFLLVFVAFIITSPVFAGETIVYPPATLQTIDAFAGSLGPSSSDTGKSASLSGNSVSVESGTIPGAVYGAININDESGVTNNSVLIKGNVSEDVYGARGRGAVANNSVEISGGSVNMTVYGGYGVSARSIDGNSVVINNGMISGSVYSGFGSWGSSTNNKVMMNDSTALGSVTGGWGIISDSDDLFGNSVTIINSRVNGGVTGGNLTRGSGIAYNNSVEIINSTVGGNVIGGIGNANAATNNTIAISDGSVGGLVIGGWSDGGTVTNNTVTITGSPTFGVNTVIRGSYINAGGGDGFTGNTFNLHGVVARVSGLRGFQFYNFYIPESLTAPMITVAAPEDITGINIDIAGIKVESELRPGDSVTLISFLSGTTGVPATPLDTDIVTSSGRTFRFSLSSTALTATLIGAEPPVIHVTGVTVSPLTATMDVGDTLLLSATISPADATNKNVAWSSNNPAVAAVNALGVVTGASPGTAAITVKTADGEFTAVCKVTVEERWGCNAVNYGYLAFVLAGAIAFVLKRK
ncbi:MAG: Ig-like domain-containing protein [Synergistaceae bacterium]|nr:Ig-like domain-containing protein [Synergistaceae bacterium]